MKILFLHLSDAHLRDNTDIRLINPLEYYDKDKILNSDKILVGTTIEVEATFIITSEDESLLKIEEGYSSTNFSLIALKSSLVNIYIFHA